MKQIKDINCICKENNSNNTNRFVGKVVVGNNGFFEGVLQDPKTYRKFIAFGYYKEGVVFNIVKGICDDEREYPKELRVRGENHSYRGEVSIKAVFADFPIGTCEVKVLETIKPRKSKREELMSLEREVNLLKVDMTKETQAVYDKCMPAKETEEKKRLFIGRKI